METVTPPAGLAEGAEIARKYRLGALLARDSRHSDYATIFRGSAATIRIFPAPATGQQVSLAGFQLAFQLHHPHLLSLFDFGEDIIEGERIAWLVMERGDECLADTLRERTLDEAEVRALIDGILPALEFLRERRLGHLEIQAANIFACGDQIKLTPDPITSAAAESGGLQISRLILESLTGSRDEAGAAGLNSPFKEIVLGAGNWDLARIRASLAGELVSSEPAPVVTTDEDTPPPKYRKYAGLAIGGVLAAAALCGLLIWGAHRKPAPVTPAARVNKAAPVVAQSVPQSATPPPVENTAAAPVPPAAAALPSPPQAVPAGWAIVEATFTRLTGAEERAHQNTREHPQLEPQIYASGKRFVVVLASGLTQSQAKKQLAAFRRSGAPRGTRIVRFR